MHSTVRLFFLLLALLPCTTGGVNSTAAFVNETTSSIGTAGTDFPNATTSPGNDTPSTMSTASNPMAARKAPAMAAKDPDILAVLRKFNVHLSTCKMNDSNFSDRMLKSTYVLQNKLIVLRGISTGLEDAACLKGTYNFSKIQLSADGGPQQHTNNGRCRPTDNGTPYESFICLCNYGYFGIHCQHEMQTKMWLLWIWMAVVLVEFILIGYAIYVSIAKTIRHHATTPLRFVEGVLDEVYHDEITCSGATRG